jgi:enoyl-CoA hydratase/carnithine racemase
VSDVATTLLDGGVALVEMRRPPTNFFDEVLLTEVADALLALDDEPRVGAVVLCSQGRHFCAGADLRGMGAAGIRRVYRQVFRTPVVAAVQGGAIGGGLGLAMAADFRIAAPDARMTANFARLGFHPGFGLTVTLRAAVGQQRALELLYTGKSIDGVAGHAIGLCDQVADDPRSAAVEFALQIAASAPLSLPAIRATMRRSLVSEVAAALDVEATAQAALLDTADFAEGVSASIEKRAPQFIGS